jgi:hypothetical protein
MKIHETLARDPRFHSLANSGQARITSDTDERAMAELRAELETFVCDGQYGDAIERILKSYLTNLDRPKQDAAWVSGFYGSGKSHLLKMLGHLWVDTSFPDGATARSLVHGLPDDVLAQLRELDTRVARSKQPAVAAAGTLPAGSGDFVKMTVLSVILAACDLPQQYAQAKFCFWLQEQGFYDAVRSTVEAEGRGWFQELNNLYVSGVIAKSLLACDPNFAGDEMEARQTLRAQFPNKSDDITTDEFLEMARRALQTSGELPLTILILDEVQQYIADSADRAVSITEVTEAIYTQLDSKIMLVASGQSVLSATPYLQRLKDRYRINAQLSDTDVEAVTRKVLLRKNASSVNAIKTTLDQNAGEIAKHLDGTRLSTRPEDSQTIVEDYPLLPSRRRFWEECFRAVDAAGTHSQLRSQLRILHDTLTQISEHDVGAVIPADALFEAISPNLVQTGVLLNEIDLRIRSLDDGTDAGTLRKRICGLVFLISKLPREGGTDVGVRATARTIADLMLGNITIDSGSFRKQVEIELEQLDSNGTLMKVDEEYRLQTTEGAEWDRAYREKAGALRQREADIAVKRDQLLGAAAQQAISEVRLLHGDCKEKRTFHLHTGSDEPNTGGDQIVAWLRDGWSIAQKEVEAEARKRGQDDHVLHVFLPRKAADDLTTRIIEVEATRQVIDLKGIPSTNEGREARESMQSRHVAALRLLEELIREITVSAKVFQGGGAEVFGESLVKKLDTAANASLARLFPNFGDGDHKSWGVALKRARDGSDEPLKIVGWDKATEDHPVVMRVMTEVGNGAKGGEIRKALQSSPCGWPRDAIDAALIALHRQGSIRAQLNHQPVAPGHLDQNKISTAEFHPEKIRLSASSKLALRGLFQKAGLSVKGGEEEIKAKEFLAVLRTLASDAGGDTPLPERPATTAIDDLDKLHGSEQLGVILDAKDALEASITEWTKIGERVVKRLPGWQRLEQMARHTVTLPVHAEIEPEIQAVAENRSLLDDTDHVTPLVTKAANALRSALTEQAAAFQAAYDSGLEILSADTSWQQLDDADRQTILSQVGLAPPAPPATKTDEDVLGELDRSSLDARVSAVAAVSERVARALEEAARRLKPEARRVGLRAATLEDEAAVKAWLSEHKTKLLEAVAKGPVIVG